MYEGDVGTVAGELVEVPEIHDGSRSVVVLGSCCGDDDGRS